MRRAWAAASLRGDLSLQVRMGTLSNVFNELSRRVDIQRGAARGRCHERRDDDAVRLLLCRSRHVPQLLAVQVDRVLRRGVPARRLA